MIQLGCLCLWFFETKVILYVWSQSRNKFAKWNCVYGCVSLQLLQVSMCEWMRVLYGEMKLRMLLCESADAASVCVCECQNSV